MTQSGQEMTINRLEFLIIIHKTYLMKQEDDKVEIKDAKGELYKTKVLDPYMGGWMIELRTTIIGGVTKAIYKVHKDSDTYILKTFNCSLFNQEAINQAKKEYELSLQCSKLTKDIARPVGYDELMSKPIKRAIIEVLYEYGGESLHSMIGTLEGEDAVEIMKKTLEPLVILEENGIFHSDLKPDNIVVKDGKIKIIDFGVSISFPSMTKLFKIAMTAGSEMIGGTYIYLPPEVLCAADYIPGKVDVYGWGMTFYQLISGKSDADLENEMKLYKDIGKDYNQFLNLVKGIKVKGDHDGSLGKWVVQLLLQVLDIDPNKRPTFAKLKAMCMRGVEDYKRELAKVQTELEAVKRERGIFCNEQALQTKHRRLAGKQPKKKVKGVRQNLRQYGTGIFEDQGGK
eukprot:TRINITY_DN323_c0_g1_i4.p2 TRINITY_DN323_c0_g1~~TRINITY_DN323_c0_g1_i4.p2  ORF type:complete len:456 (+),score=36.68 TRINITY_DN323_c0_g1_i4:170-1369(+)